VARSENFEGSRVAFLEKRERCVGDVSREVKDKGLTCLLVLGHSGKLDTSVAEVKLGESSLLLK
jgi:hypothetical protein